MAPNPVRNTENSASSLRGGTHFALRKVRVRGIRTGHPHPKFAVQISTTPQGGGWKPVRIGHCALPIAVAATIASAVFFPAVAQTIPDLSGPWGRNVLYLESPPSGAGPVTNRMKRLNGSQDGSALFGDYTNPILKPPTADALKRFGAVSLTGVAAPN